MGKKTALQVLAENVDALRRVAGNPSSQAEIAKVAKIDQTTVGRMLRMANSLRIDALDGAAGAIVAAIKAWPAAPTQQARLVRAFSCLRIAGRHQAATFKANMP